METSEIITAPVTAPAASEGVELVTAPSARKASLLSKVRAYRRIGLPVTAAVVALTAFLPWLRVVGLINTNQSLMDGGDGWILLGGAALTALLGWRVKTRWPAVLTGFGTLALAVFEVVNVLDKIHGMTSELSQLFSASLGYGAYLGVAAAAVLVIFAGVGRQSSWEL
jgi:hypothetical protein